ncbi:uncharacterized protein EI97DRAFT_504387 [Westerdykella ornata]|uniref:Uncharacterized protein n=1 Tax=Westerdykella ornata TaxID=318751 RepID=A0A6A6J764_WESOR|nr:uncharacterized protein EI97DRAFT_504387 [Westerdykella ornata]KAF2272252.1 hypothetical protein EI97DRAFT_504387 [Westerdykella ornata]
MSSYSNADSDYDSDLAAQLEDGVFDKARARPYEVPVLQRIQSYWKQFAKSVRLPTPNDNPFDTAPPIPQVKVYFKWRVKKGHGCLTSKICITTLVKEFEQLHHAIRYGSGHRYTQREVFEVRKFIEDLSREGACTRAVEKPVALYVDVEEILRFLWCEDPYNWTHPRQIIQMTWYLLLASFYGLRPGKITESSHHWNSNEGILYKDVSLYLHRQEDKSLKYLLKINLRNRKHRRGVEGISQVITLYEEKEPNTHACPVRWFLYLALADDVFRDNINFDERCLSPTVTSVKFPIKQEKENLPVLRAMDGPGGKSISPNRLWNAANLSTALAALGRRCGYKDTVSPYSVRRGFANGIEGKTSAPKLRQLMGHSNDGILQAYLSQDVGIDAQNAIRGLPQDTARMDSCRSIGFARNKDAPMPWAGLIGLRQPPCPDEDVATVVTVKERKKKVKVFRQRLLSERRQRCFGGELEDCEQDDELLHVGPSRVLTKPIMEEIFRVDAARRQVKEVLWERKSTTHSHTFLLPVLIAMANPKPFVAAYPDMENPIDHGHCTSCSGHQVGTRKNTLL